MEFKEIRISRDDFFKIDEKDVMFITNPGRMGDEDGSTESSDHTTSAQRTENDVNTLLVVVTPQILGDAGVDPKVDDKVTINGFVRVLEKADGEFTTSGTTIRMNAIERVDYIQTYNVLVVVNPVSGLLTAIENKNHNEAYNIIRNYSGVGYEDIGDATAESLSFMMSNQSEETVTPTEANQIESNPAKAEVEVERAVSKITYRPSGANLDNTFPINVEINNYIANAERFWYVEKYTKEEILEFYVNDSYLGGSVYGVEEASKYYFNKSATELNLEESAMLAGIIKAPSYYSPINNYDNAFKRRNCIR